MKKPSYMFTNKSQSQRGIISAIVGMVDLLSLGLTIWSSYRGQQSASARFGTVALFALLFSVIGIVIGILSRMEKDRFYLFSNLGIILNFLVIVFVGFILFVGVNG